jgi:predicted metal-dependent enzyme (double-stranded beta helix superfamily)
MEFSRFVATEAAAGRYPYVEYTQDQRWHQRLYRDRRVDVWLISWLPSQGTELHDHGGSAGAFTVLSGELAEAVYRPRGGLRQLARPAGDSVGFGPRYVHDVRNLGDRPAVSVHAYSPPLTAMTFYDLEPDGGLSTLLTVATDDPEPELRRPGRAEPAA